jgi:O-antigen/teichoic acid export membrane protein
MLANSTLITVISQIRTSVLISNTFIYTFSNILNKIVPFLLLPVLTRYLSPSDYGMVAMFQMLLGIAVITVGLNSHGAIKRKYIDKDEIDFPQYVSNSLYILIISSIILAILSSPFLDQIASVTNIPSSWMWVVLLVAFCQVMTMILLSIWQAESKAKYYLYFSFSVTLVNVFVSLWLIVVEGHKWEGRLEGLLVTYIIFSILALTLLIKGRWLRWKLNLSYIKSNLKFGIPLIPHTLGMLAISMTDRFLIANMVGIAEAGVYVVGAQIGMIIGLLQDSFNKAWVPWFFEQLKKENKKQNERIVKITYVYYIVIILFALGLGFSAPYYLSVIVGDEFIGASVFILWIALGYAFNGMYKMAANFIFYIEKTYYLAWLTFITASMNIIFSLILIKLNGPVGAAQGTMLAYFISFVLTWLLANKLFQMPWKLNV